MEVVSVKACAVLVALSLASAGLAACASGAAPPSATATGGRIRIVAAENEYGDVAGQIGGDYVSVYSVVSNPNTDPHTYEISSRVAAAVASAAIVVQNGAGYDPFMQKLESVSSAGQQVIVAQQLLGVPGDVANPHLWYDPKTMPLVAASLARALTRLLPSHADYFTANVRRFDSSLQPWIDALARFRRDHAGVAVASTEPVAGYLLQAAGARDRTPMSFQTDIMNGTDPAPQDLTLVAGLISRHQVKALVYNRQVTDSVTAGFVKEAQRHGVPVVGVYETMPEPGYDYQSWMLAEVHALDGAVTAGISSERL